MTKTVTENGVKIEIPAGLKPSEQVKLYNPKLELLREIVLQTLKNEASKIDKPLLCLDAYSGSGLTGLQWKHHLKEKVHVIMSEETYGKVNCAINEMEHSDWLWDPSHIAGQWPAVKQNSHEVHICPYKANVILREEAFNFIFVQRLFNAIALCTDAVFSNIRHNGVACFLTPSMASPCFRSPKIIQRLYQAYTQKTEYVNELAVRIFIADLAKAAARHQRGITVLITISAEDHFLVVVRVTRNNQSAISCVDHCRLVLHCLMCEERVVYPQTNTPVENPYAHIPCDCKENKPGKTAVILGPLWMRELFSVPLIQQLLAETNNMKSVTQTNVTVRDICTKLKTLLNSILDEALCRSEGPRSDTAENMPETTEKYQAFDKSEECSEPAKKKSKVDNGIDHELESQESVENTTTDSVVYNTCIRSTRKDEKQSMPIFYYDLQTKKYKVLPKLDKLVVLLRAAGYRACRTHFECHAIRTSANLSQLNEVVHKLIKN